MTAWISRTVWFAAWMIMKTDAFASNPTCIPRRETQQYSTASESMAAAGFNSNDDGNEVDVNAEFQKFLQQTRDLSEQRNLKLERVLNARDLSTCEHSPIIPGRVYRTGKLSEASEHDMKLLMEEVGLKTIVDLRSATELKDDTHLGAPIYGNFTNVVWKDRGRKKDGCIRVLKSNESPVKDRFWKRSHRNLVVEDMIVGNQEDEAEADHCDECGSMGAVVASEYEGPGKERLFVPLMNEFKYVKGTIGKLRKRDLVRAMLRAPGSVFSKRVRKKLKKPFLSKINGGGLQMLNELLLRYGAPGIRYVLEVCADKERHPVAFYCTAGKDRTGAIAAIILALCGVEPEHIVEDYSLSANVYADLDDGNAMVGALSQRDLDPQVFLGAPPEVMRETLNEIKEQYGSISAYATWIGFGPEKQQKLRDALLT